jgi:pyridoxine 4-dehydrogenase
VDERRISHVGVSAVGIDEIERARRVVPIEAVQNHYNLSHREHEAAPLPGDAARPSGGV